jgi:hypothetical protein
MPKSSDRMHVVLQIFAVGQVIAGGRSGLLSSRLAPGKVAIPTRACRK